MISVSFLGIKEQLKENLERLDQTNISYIHFDIMDGKFVQNRTWNVQELLPLVQNLKKPFDVHLMVEDLPTYIQDFAKIHPEYITFHLEATEDPIKTIKQIKETNSKVGISIKPNTSVESLLPYLDQIDLVLVMSVEPGKGGQKLITKKIEKISKLKKYLYENNLETYIEADGGINTENVNILKEAGADILVVGSFIINSEDYKKTIQELKKY